MTATLARPTTTEPVRATARSWWALAVLMLPVLLISIDNTVLSFALPEISRSLQPSATAQLWIIDVYPLVLAGLLISMGNLGDRIGRRRILLIGATGFAVVSAFAAFAPTAETLIAARAALGFFGAMLMPATLALLRSLFQVRSQRTLAIAIWATGFAAGGALGPIVGGILLEHFWWGSVFLIALPLLVPLLVMAPTLIPESRDPHPGRIDPISIVLSILTLAPIVYAIKESSTGHAGWVEIVAALVGVLSGVLFVRRQMRSANPMLDVRLFRSPVFSGAILVNLLCLFGFVGFLLFASQHLQLVLEMSPLDAAMILVPGLGAMVVSGLAVVPVVRRVRPAIVVTTSLLAGAAAYAIVAMLGEGGSAFLVMGAFVLLGIGIGAAETVSNDLVIAAVPPAKAGAASAVSETAYELGAVLGTTVLGTVLAVFYRTGVYVPPGAAESAQQAGETLGGAVAVAETLSPLDAAMLMQSARAAFDSGVTVTAAIAAAVMVGAAVLAAVTLRKA